MKFSHLLLIGILLCAVMAVPVSAQLKTTTINGAYTLDIYTNVTGIAGNSTWTPPAGVTSVQYLVVAGGGAGGGESNTGSGGGGGGAGGWKTNVAGEGVGGTTGSDATLTGGALTVTVGAGGVAWTGRNAIPASAKGSNSIFSDITSTGGGSGSAYGYAGGDGGSGGGAGTEQTKSGGAASPSGQGNAGGNAVSTNAGGNGGGAGGAGGTTTTSATNAGAGLYTSLLGTTLAGGGGCGADITYIRGTGVNGGGSGGISSSVGAGGTNGTGGGGGGWGAGTGSGYSGSGGSGIVVIRYLTPTPPVASFTTNTTSGAAPLAVILTDTSTNTPTSRTWGAKNLTPGNNTWFSLGTTTPITTVLGIGNWSINLTATNAVGSNISTQVTWVNVSASVPVISFSTNVTSGVNPLSLYLNDTSTGSPTYWNTSWGESPIPSWTNQTSFPATNITHIYSTAGSYWINQYATNAYGTANGTPILITVYGFANSQFSVFNTAGNAPYTTYLYDTSTNTTGGTNSWSWMFGDGNTSTSQNVFHTWNMTGTFSVNHSFSNGLSTSWKNQSAYIVVGTPTPPVVAPVASFYGGPQIISPPQNVFFTDVSSNTPTSWNWSFGDGVFGITQNPTHLYTGSGFYTVSLTATNTAGSNLTIQSNYIIAE